MQDVLALLTEIAERPGAIRSIYLLVKFKGDEDFAAADSSTDPDDLTFELASEVIRRRGG